MAPRLSLTSTVHDTTLAQGGRFSVPFVLTWHNQPADSVLYTIDNRPPNINLDLASSTATITDSTVIGSVTVLVGFLDPGTYPVNLVARGAAHGMVSIPFTITVTLTQ